MEANKAFLLVLLPIAFLIIVPAVMTKYWHLVSL